MIIEIWVMAFLFCLSLSSSIVAILREHPFWLLILNGICTGYILARLLGAIFDAT